MDNLVNNNATIQISAENLEKLKSVLAQLNIKIDMPQTKNITVNQQEKTFDDNEEEDFLDPLVPEDSDDDLDDDLDKSHANQNIIKPVTSTRYTETEFLQDDMNEITPDDIIEEDAPFSRISVVDDQTTEIRDLKHHSNNDDQNSDSDLDLASEEEDLNLSSPKQYQPIVQQKQLQPINTIQHPFTLTNTQQPYAFSKLQPKSIPQPPIATIINKNKLSKGEILKMENKITLNVGGKNFNTKKNLLEYLGINYSKLHKITKEDGRIIYFLDRDPYYFSKMINLIKLYGLEHEKIIEHIEDYSEQLVSELCYYGLIDKKYTPTPKLRLKYATTIPSRHDNIVKIIVGDQFFESSSGILSKSHFFDNKLKMSRKKRFYLTDVDPKIFRYVLNFLRTGELYISNTDVIELLNNYGIEFEKLENKQINESIVSHYLPHGFETVHNQIIGCISNMDPRVNAVPGTNNMFQFIDNKYYYPDNMFVSPNVENINIITTDSKLAFDSEIIFNLADPIKEMGSCIDDLLLCIDIPVLKSTESYEYIDMVEYQLIEYLSIVTNDGVNKKIILQTNNELLYLYPIIYTNHANDYHEMTKIGDKKVKLLYDNTLIDIHRITIPLFLFRDGQNHLPIKKMINNKISTIMVVKMAPLKKLFKNKIKDTPLLNICLISNFINLAPGMIMQNPTENNQQNNQQNTFPIVPLNEELVTQPTMYIYDKFHPLTVAIQATPNPIYDIAVVPLDKFGLIKDFFFTIIEKDDLISGRIDKFSDQLIELEILQIKENPQTHQKMLALHSKLDSSMLNYYIPIKKLDHKLPSGIYYHSFSANPKSSQILGGLAGLGYVIRIKVKKMDGFIKFYANEYYKEII